MQNDIIEFIHEYIKLHPIRFQSIIALFVLFSMGVTATLFKKITNKSKNKSSSNSKNKKSYTNNNPQYTEPKQQGTLISESTTKYENYPPKAKVKKKPSKTKVDEKLTEPKVKKKQEDKQEDKQEVNQLLVNYHCNLPDNINSYPVLRIPKHECVIRPQRAGKTQRRGYKEESFEALLRKVLSEDYQVLGNTKVKIGNTKKSYEPDIAIICQKNINIKIDIEIDEPYAGIGRELTHIKGTDKKRDKYFKDRGWIVIRFNEYQIHKQEESCLKYIAELIKSIDNAYAPPEYLSNADVNSNKELWDEALAKQWENENFREEYLNHSFESVEIDNAEDNSSQTQLEIEAEELVEESDEVILAEEESSIKEEHPAEDSYVSKEIPIHEEVVAPYEYDYPEKPVENINFNKYTDNRDGNVYNTLEIGKQVWLVDNLRYDTGSGSWAYDNDEKNVALYGRLYDSSGAKKAVPDGWDLPSDEEWQQLELYFGMGKSEIENTGWRSNLKNDFFKDFFSLHRGGKGGVALAGSYSGIMFTSIGSSGYYWTASNTENKQWIRLITKSLITETVNQINRSMETKGRAMSIRCIKHKL
jgi:uncharacterized protein (TIGR02145 family)